MNNRTWLLAAAGALALPLVAASAFAQGQSTGSVGSYMGSTYRMDHKGEGSEHTSWGRHRHAQKKAASHGAMAAKSPRRMEAVPTGAASTEQLNEMSLSAAKSGQNFAPAPAPSGAPAAPGKTM